MNYRQFVKENFHKLGDIPAKDKMRKIGQMWRQSGHAKGGATVGGATVGGGTTGGRVRRGAKGGGILSGLLGTIGLGVEPKKRGRKARGKGVAGGDVAGGDFLDDIVGGVKGAMHLAPLIGLGVKKRGRKAKGMGVAGGDVAGGSLFGDMARGFSQGFMMPFQAIKSLTGGDLAQAEHGSGIFSGLLGSIGLGMPEKALHKHYMKMCKLENKLHSNAKLTPKEHQHLKVYHHLHGAGFFDKLFSGAKKAVGAVVNNLDTIKKVVPEVAKFVPESVKSKIPGTVRSLAKI